MVAKVSGTSHNVTDRGQRHQGSTQRAMPEERAPSPMATVANREVCPGARSSADTTRGLETIHIPAASLPTAVADRVQSAFIPTPRRPVIPVHRHNGRRY